MKYLIIIASIMWGLFFYTNAKANEYTIATGAHIITETIKGTDIDEQAILNAETQRLIHQMSLDIIKTMFQVLPDVLDGISAQSRQEADLRYKCSLQNNWITYANKECKKYN